MTDAHALRLQLVQAGYLPIPLHGKIPPQRSWQKTESVTPEMLEMSAKTWPDATNTGVLTRTMPTLDANILDKAAAKARQEFVRERYGYVLTRVGKPPKFAIPFRTEEPFKKIVVNLIAPDGSEGQKIELLADGEQVVVAGIHPDTKQPYRWSNGGLEQLEYKHLHEISAKEAHTLVDELVEILVRDFRYKRAPSRPRANGRTAPGAHDGGGGGDRDWQTLTQNILTGRELHDSITILAAKMIACGTNPGATINQLRALMEASTAPKDDRWHARVSQIPAAVDSALAKFGKQPEATDNPPSARSSSEPAAEPTGKTPPRLQAAHNVFRKWLDKEYDIDVLDAVLAAGAAERLTGDPLWLLVISGPGNAKTETVQSLMGAGAIVTSTITSEGALLSATKKNAKGATGGLLCELEIGRAHV